MIFTLGHSTLTRDEFVAAARRMDVIADVRSHPGSRHVPHFNREEMAEWLPVQGLAYEWWPGLGGWAERHMQDPDLAEYMGRVGVDISAYARGAFPRQRIGVDRPTPASAALNQGRPAGEVRPTWTNQGLFDYSHFMQTPEFLDSAEGLIQRFGDAGQPNVAIVCCEAVYFKCHRSMVADYLHWCDVPSFHLPVKPPKRPTTRRFKPHAEVLGNRLQRYDPAIVETWVEHLLALRR